jgi:hypothetical protein
MTRYIQREAGVMVGHFANPNSLAQEAVPDDHPDIVAWNTERRERRGKKQEVSISLQERVEQLEAQVAELTKAKR